MGSDYRTNAKPEKVAEARKPFWERMFPKREPTEEELIEEERQRAILALEQRAREALRSIDQIPGFVVRVKINDIYHYGLYLSYSQKKGLYFENWHDPHRIDAVQKGFVPIALEWTLPRMQEAVKMLPDLITTLSAEIDQRHKKEQEKKAAASEERQAWSTLSSKLSSENDYD